MMHVFAMSNVPRQRVATMIARRPPGGAPAHSRPQTKQAGVLSSPLEKCGTGYQPVKNTGKIAGVTLPMGFLNGL
jgi:hypothetical protein